MNVVIYCRVSTKDKEQNPERQVFPCIKYCEFHEHKIINIIREKHEGDSSPFERPEFKNINLKQIQGIIVYSIDRLTRQHPTKVMNLLNRFKDMGIKIVSITEPIFNMESEMAEPLQYFMTWWNNYFLKKLSRDVISGLERAKKEGRFGGRPKIKINQYEIKRLKEQGKSIRQIAKELNLSVSVVQRCSKNIC